MYSGEKSLCGIRGRNDYIIAIGLQLFQQPANFFSIYITLAPEILYGRHEFLGVGYLGMALNNGLRHN